MRTCTAFVAGFSLLVAACGGQAPGDRREYKLQGQIVSVSTDGKEAIIKHEDIPGFMPAMTMPYHVRDTKEFATLAAGDLINATLIVETRDAYVERVKKVGAAPLERPAGSATAPGATELLATGQPVPNVRLTDQDGRPFGIDAFQGSAVIVSFTYTTCPMPDMCPLIDRQFVAIQQKLRARHNELRARLLTVSLDPAHDTPEVLTAYGRRLDVDPTLWTLATGEVADIDTWASKFGVSVLRTTNNPTDITHNLRTVVLDRQGNLVQSYSGTTWTPDQVLADVRVMVGID